MKKVELFDLAHSQKFVDALLDRSMKKEFFLTVAERGRMLDILKRYPKILERKGTKRMFAPTKRKRDLDGYDWSRK